MGKVGMHLVKLFGGADKVHISDFVVGLGVGSREDFLLSRAAMQIGIVMERAVMADLSGESVVQVNESLQLTPPRRSTWANWRRASLRSRRAT